MLPALFPVRFVTVPTYADFAELCLKPNRPAVLPRALIEDWRCVRDWVADDGSVSFEALRREFRHAKVTIEDCSSADRARRSAQLTDVLAGWERGEGRRLYVKDFHAALVAEKDFYSCPPLFADDWLNAAAMDGAGADGPDDYRFVYLGPAGTSTGLHTDVMRSFSWSTNLAGRKRWLLFDERTTDELRDDDGDAHARSQAVEIIQEAGETVFVPSSWSHACVC